MNSLVSVIVPIYMIDQYLGLCIESIINQSYINLEIILVDDGSLDRCPELCDLYAKKDSRIKVIHKENGGLVSARKTGLRHSKGEYISFVDGDDWIDPDFIEELYRVAVKSGADVVCAGFARNLFSKTETFANSVKAGLYEGSLLEEFWSSMISCETYYRPGVTTYVWNKLFRRDVILDCQFCVDNRITIGEDAAVTYPVLFKSRKVAVIENASYHYRQREDSMLKQRSEYVKEAEKLLYLYKFLARWANGTNPRFNLSLQIEDYILANAIMRSGGYLLYDDYSAFNKVYYGKKIVIYNAGTFGQQMINRFRESKHCDVVAWIDDDYWEYRRCCLDVDSVETISSLEFDYVLIAKIDGQVAEEVRNRLIRLGVDREKILTVTVSQNKKQLIDKFLHTETS